MVRRILPLTVRAYRPEVRSSSDNRDVDGGFMADWHVPVEWLERFLRLEPAEDEAREVARHLASGCQECVDLAYRITAEIGLSGSSEEGRAAWELAYEEVFARAFAFADEGERR